MKDRILGDGYEKEIIQKCQKGNRKSFEELITIFGGKILNYINYYIHNDIETSKDLTQETFIHVYKSISKLQDIDKFRNWIYTIATNKCKDYFRKNKNRPIVDSELVYKVNTVKIGKEYIRKEFTEKDTVITMDTINEIINSFPEKTKKVFILKKYDNMKFDEISKVMHCSLRTVKYKMKQAVNMFYDELSKRGFQIEP